jgi:CheY-like chemotaxis protein
MQRVIGVLLAMMLVVVPALGQGGKEPPKRDKEEPTPPDRELFKKPETTAEYWDSIQFELGVGRYDLAAGRLHGLLQYKPSDADLVRLADEHGIAAFLKLRNIPKWYDPPHLPDDATSEQKDKALKETARLNKRARDDVEALIQRVTEAVKIVRGDPKRIELFIGNLLASPEERAYALKELSKSGPVAVPYMIKAIRRQTELTPRQQLVDALRQLGPDTLRPILAALDSNDKDLILDIINICRRRAAVAAVPELWYLSASESQPEVVRAEAAAALAYFLEMPVSKLPPAKAALVREALTYYNHEGRWAKGPEVIVWRWDGKEVVEGWPAQKITTIPQTKAEEYYGMRYAGQALALDPSYAPAQMVWLSLALDKAQTAAGLSGALDDKVHAMLASVSPDLVSAILARAIKEDRVPVILAAVRDLGARDEVRAARPTDAGPPPLVQALYYPDRRVQLAAAEALLRIPGPPAPNAAARIVEVLRRALAAAPSPPMAAVRPKVLIGYFDEARLDRVADALRALRLDPVKASTGRVLLQRLTEAADIDVILIDHALPDPSLTHLLGQLNADRNGSRLPVIVTAPPEREEALRRLWMRSATVTIAPEALLAPANRDGLARLLTSRLSDSAHPPLTPPELKAGAELAVALLAHLAKGEPQGYDIAPAATALIAALRQPDQLVPERQIDAAEAVSHLRGTDPQAALADVVLDAKRKNAVRVAAAADLIRHIQTYGPLLARAHVQALTALDQEPKIDPILKAQLALVLGSLHPSPRLSGERLLQYRPPEPGKLPEPKKPLEPKKP